MNKRSINLIGILTFFFVGTLNAGTQSIVNNISNFWDASENQMGAMVSIFYAGSLLVTLFMGEAAEKKGKKWGLCVSALALMLGAATIFMGGSLALVFAGLIICGFAYGGLESLIMSVVEDVNGSGARRVIGIMEIALGLGGVIAPAAVSFFLGSELYKPMYVVALIAGLLLLVIYTRLKGIEPEHEKTEETAENTEKQGSSSILAALKNRTLCLSLVSIFIYLGVESTVTTWSVKLMTDQGFGHFGSMAISAYWFAVMICPYLSTKIPNYLKLFPYCFGLGGAAILVMVFAPIGWVKMVSMVAIGIMIGPSFANLTFLGGHSARENSAAAYSLLVFFGCLGSVLFQPVAAEIVRRTSAPELYFVLAALCVINAFIIGRCVKAYNAQEA